MKKIITILIIVLIIFGFYKITSKKPISIANTPDADYILFYGNTCPHCKVVEEFISLNKIQIDQKFKISQLEVYEDKSNSALFSSMVKEICPEQVAVNGLPVPFLIDPKNKKCLNGDTIINEFLSEKLK